MRRVPLILVVLLVSTTALFCGPSDSSEETPEDGPVSKVIGPEGGTLDDGNGASIEIPAGALAERVEISIEAHTSEADLPASFGPLLPFGGGITLEPSGTTFAKPVAITFPVPGAEDAAEVPLWLWDTERKAWHHQKEYGQIAAGVFTAQIEHFTSRGVSRMQAAQMIEREFIKNPELPMALRLQQLADFITQNIVSPGDKKLARTPGGLEECTEVASILLQVFGQDDEFWEHREGEPGGLTDDWPYIIFLDLSLKAGEKESVFVQELQVHVETNCVAPEMIASAARDLVEIGRSTPVTASLICGDAPFSEQNISFSASGTGSVDPSSERTSEKGTAATTFTGTSEGTAIVTAIHAYCVALSPGEQTQQVGITVVEEGEEPIPEMTSWSATFSTHGVVPSISAPLTWDVRMNGTFDFITNDPSCSDALEPYLSDLLDPSAFDTCGRGTAHPGLELQGEDFGDQYYEPLGVSTGPFEFIVFGQSGFPDALVLTFMIIDSGAQCSFQYDTCYRDWCTDPDSVTDCQDAGGSCGESSSCCFLSPQDDEQHESDCGMRPVFYAIGDPGAWSLTLGSFQIPDTPGTHSGTTDGEQRGLYDSIITGDWTIELVKQ